MKKKIWLLPIVLCLLLNILSPAPVHSQGQIAVQSSSAKVNFPAQITFNLAAKDDVNMVDIRLRYIIVQMSFTQEFNESFVQFNPGTTVQTSWVLETRQTGGLPPGTAINYWWIIKDADGNRLETKPQEVDFNDNRYQWHNISQGLVTLYWYQGDNSFANQLMTVAQQALTNLKQNTGAALANPIKMYIYASPQDLQGALIFAAEWTGGIAFTQFGIIAIGIAPNNLAFGVRAVAHELTHLVVHQIIFNPYNQLPTWLDEGLAVNNEGPANSSFTAILNQAIASNQLISLRSLTSPFSAYSDEASLSYAESYSVVNYLIGTYGQAKMLDLLDTFHEGSTYDGAFQKVYGFNMDQLYNSWKQKVAPQRSARIIKPVTIPVSVAFKNTCPGGRLRLSGLENSY